LVKCSSPPFDTLAPSGVWPCSASLVTTRFACSCNFLIPQSLRFRIRLSSFHSRSLLRELHTNSTTHIHFASSAFLVPPFAPISFAFLFLFCCIDCGPRSFLSLPSTSVSSRSSKAPARRRVCSIRLRIRVSSSDLVYLAKFRIPELRRLLDPTADLSFPRHSSYV